MFAIVEAVWLSICRGSNEMFEGLPFQNWIDSISNILAELSSQVTFWRSDSNSVCSSRYSDSAMVSTKEKFIAIVSTPFFVDVSTDKHNDPSLISRAVSTRNRSRTRPMTRAYFWSVERCGIDTKLAASEGSHISASDSENLATLREEVFEVAWVWNTWNKATPFQAFFCLYRFSCCNTHRKTACWSRNNCYYPNNEG